jgi:agmatine/peptidylarginine deiminase
VRELSFREPVRLLVVDEAMADAAHVALRAAGADCERVTCHAVPTDDAWLRDTGPLFVKRESDGARCSTFPSMPGVASTRRGIVTPLCRVRSNA